MTTAELLLHPVRLRIVQALLGDRTATTAQLRALLEDVSTATLYRQIATLVDAGVLEVVSERRVRGTVERTYRLVTERAHVTGDQAEEMSADDHRRAFLAFTAQLLADFDAYLDDPGRRRMVEDVVGYRQIALDLTDEEALALVTEMAQLFARYAELGPGPGRRRRLISRIIVPARDPGDVPPEE
ncbi:helix-turn-helix domain-containing protein [Rhodococcus sp. Z13]|uniref:Helix-turn-helix domain-containing protein n=1 Tax=Rhodococcus sacchari TaxID=2962047 RepID=A0ACD4DIE8_9NOCA|nr:helix-turn-helix domain-containing protein [Rhodococcus sp. Z13]UYP19468.1 helix-turn-helix domain-containing protein [Rhodococcus sp. Z13]